MTTNATNTSSPPTSTSIEDGGGGGGPAEGFARPESPLDVGPVFALSWWRLWGGAVIGAAIVSGLVGLVLAFAYPPGAKGALLALGAVAPAHLIGVLFMRPWRRMFLGRWPFVVLASSGVSLGFVLILLLLLYFAAQPEPVSFWLTGAAGWLVAFLSEIAVYTADVRKRSGSSSD